MSTQHTFGGGNPQPCVVPKKYFFDLNHYDDLTFVNTENKATIARIVARVDRRFHCNVYKTDANLLVVKSGSNYVEVDFLTMIERCLEDGEMTSNIPANLLAVLEEAYTICIGKKKHTATVESKSTTTDASRSSNTTGYMPDNDDNITDDDEEDASHTPSSYTFERPADVGWFASQSLDDVRELPPCEWVPYYNDDAASADENEQYFTRGGSTKRIKIAHRGRVKNRKGGHRRGVCKCLGRNAWNAALVCNCRSDSDRAICKNCSRTYQTWLRHSRITKI